MSKETEDLSVHVSLCEMRYKRLEERLDAVEIRLNSLQTEIHAVKTQMQTSFGELRLLIERQNNIRATQIIASAGAIIVALVGTVAYFVR